MSDTQYTAAEEAFIEAQGEVFRLTEAQFEAQNAANAALAATEPLTEALDLPEGRVGMERMFELMMEAGHRVGFSDDSEVLGTVVDAHDWLVQQLNQLDNQITEGVPGV